MSDLSLGIGMLVFLDFKGFLEVKLNTDFIELMLFRDDCFLFDIELNWLGGSWVLPEKELGSGR